MATETELAKAFVTFSQKGVEELKGHVDKAVKSASAFTGVYKKAESAATVFGKHASAAFAGVQSLAGKFALGGGLGIGGLLAGAGAGTVEMDQFTMAMTRLVRVVGDKLAPYVRMATEAVVILTEVWQSLSGDLQESITKWAVITTAIAGVIVILPQLVKSIQAVLVVLSSVRLLANPWVALGVAIGVVATEAGLFGEKARAGLEGIIPGLQTVREAFAGWFKSVWSSFEDMIRRMLVSLTDLSARLGFISEETAKAFRDAKQRLEDEKKINAMPIPPAGAALGRKPDQPLEEFRKRNLQPPAKPDLKPWADWLARILKAGEDKKGFGRGQVGWEEIGAGWSRIQAATASNNPLASIADNTKNTNDGVKTLGELFRRLLGAWPPVKE